MSGARRKDARSYAITTWQELERNIKSIRSLLLQAVVMVVVLSLAASCQVPRKPSPMNWNKLPKEWVGYDSGAISFFDMTFSGNSMTGVCVCLYVPTGVARLYNIDVVSWDPTTCLMDVKLKPVGSYETMTFQAQYQCGKLLTTMYGKDWRRKVELLDRQVLLRNIETSQKIRAGCSSLGDSAGGKTTEKPAELTPGTGNDQEKMK